MISVSAVLLRNGIGRFRIESLNGQTISSSDDWIITMNLGFTTWLSYFFGLWASIYLTDAALRAHPYTRQWYHSFVTRLGISFNILQARLFTERFNELFHYIGHFEFVPWKMWFSCGVLFSAVSMFFSVFLLTLLVYNTLIQKPIKGGTLTPVMPGVNLPISHLGFYMLTLLLCAVLHEAGHALAALRERVRLHGFGVFLFGCYPGAFVDLNTADLRSLSPFGQLRVYCAGVWHNAVIALLSLAVFYAMPVLLAPGYRTGDGVGVMYLRENSVVTGNRGLSLGDLITHVNSCPVTNQSEWYRCLTEAHRMPSGYCVPGLYLQTVDGTVKSRPAQRNLAAAVVPVRSDQNTASSLSFVSASISDCCTHQSASTHLCFTYNVSSKYGCRSSRYACLPARPVTERTSCHSSADCGPISLVRSAGRLDVQSGPAGRYMHCVVPSPPDNQTRLVRLAHNRKEAPAVLFLGPIDDLLASVGVSDYVSRWPRALSPRFPVLLSLLCTYLFSLSGALVILNVVPCYALDGQWILKALIDLCLPYRRVRRVVFRVILFSGTGLLCANFLLAFWHFFLDHNMLRSHPSSVT